MLRVWRNDDKGAVMEMTVAADAKRGPRPRRVLRMRAREDGRVVIGEGVYELLLAMTVCCDRHVSLDELAEVVLEVDRLVGREELEGG
jgi:hypothetical protein